jgi:hypothetical protein
MQLSTKDTKKAWEKASALEQTPIFCFVLFVPFVDINSFAMGVVPLPGI